MARLNGKIQNKIQVNSIIQKSLRRNGNTGQDFAPLVRKIGGLDRRPPLLRKSVINGNYQRVMFFLNLAVYASFSKLLRDGRVRLKDCKSPKGKTYNATVLLAAESDGHSKFSLEFENGGH